MQKRPGRKTGTGGRERPQAKTNATKDAAATIAAATTHAQRRQHQDCGDERAAPKAAASTRGRTTRSRSSSTASRPASPTRRRTRVNTLAIDIGGSGFKATVLDPDGQMLADRVRVDTPYPCPPDQFVETVTTLVNRCPTRLGSPWG